MEQQKNGDRHCQNRSEMRGLGRLLVAAGLLIAAATADAKINCDQVRLYIKTGRTVEDVAETMIIPVEEVKKCLEQGTEKSQPTPGPDSGS